MLCSKSTGVLPRRYQTFAVAENAFKNQLGVNAFHASA